MNFKTRVLRACELTGREFKKVWPVIKILPNQMKYDLVKEMELEIGKQQTEG